ncbi:DUF4249 domain-containing protein [Pontibacter harenae]|uniref:DUF4249 domain-containing protein n=1 Tax=Pontibacter harenae TaxID=2894083 RepID=UPI001E61933E|nr:DUF4249 domain-containing protein [Pontibacter harenae]MCC9167131.1 DUF4249 domain-containing protein [Pontibacter harenae]
MKTLNWKNAFSWLLMLLVSCVEPYTPDVLDAPNNFLVVNGFININGPSTIQLLRTQNIYDESQPLAESGAMVKIEEEQGPAYTLEEQAGGYYVLHNLDLNILKKYRLYIRTSNGKEYVSDFIDVKPTPAIDAITWKPVDDAVQLYVSTHDDENNTWYYRWEYEDTWEFTAAYYSYLRKVGDEIVYRDLKYDNIYKCWKTEKSTTIELGSSVMLSQDVISNYKLLTIPATSEKVGLQYSILVKQFALTREAYQYWEILKKNTESIGTLFDPLPSQLTGNIRCVTDPDEPVVGYMSASSMQQKRITIKANELPDDWRLFYPRCAPLDTIPVDKAIDFLGETGGYLPVGEVFPENSPTQFPIGYTYSNRSCVDCTVRGTNVKPGFWE